MSSQLFYGAEISGMEIYEELERCQYYACKRFMVAKQTTLNYLFQVNFMILYTTV